MRRNIKANEILVNINKINEKLDVIDKIKETKNYRTMVDALERNINMLSRRSVPLIEFNILELRESEFVFQHILKPIIKEYKSVHDEMQKLIDKNEMTIYHDLTIAFEKLYKIKCCIEFFIKVAKKEIKSREIIVKINNKSDEVIYNINHSVLSFTKDRALQLLLNLKIKNNNDIYINNERSKVLDGKDTYRMFSNVDMLRSTKGETLYIDKELGMDYYFNEIKPIVNNYKNVEFI
jgi:hypothetical protein